MKDVNFKNTVQAYLSPAGITINGDNPWDITVMNDKFYQRVLREGSLGLGESYMEGWWECDRLDDFFYRLLPSNPEKKVKRNLKFILHLLLSIIFNPGSRSRAFQIGERHYDIGNELYRHMLDRR